MHYVYILASKRNGTIYIGSTSNLESRIKAHKDGLFDGFTKKYKVDRLVYYEEFETRFERAKRERQLKHWNRKWKLELIEKENPTWRDLAEELF